MARAWITDGSVPVFDDTVKLSASHKGLFGLPVRYEGFVDDAVGRGALTVDRQGDGDALFAEAEWYLELPDGIDGFLEDETRLSPVTPVTLQGFIEGKWMRRLLGTRAWKPASMGNNVIADGPGIATTLGALDAGTVGVAHLEYVSTRGTPCTHVTDAADLVGHNIGDLVRDVLKACREAGTPIDGINLGAVGEAAAVVNDKARLKRAIRLDAIPLPNPLNFAPHRAKERLVQHALADGLEARYGSEITLTTRDGAGAEVGRAVLTLGAP